MTPSGSFSTSCWLSSPYSFPVFLPFRGTLDREASMELNGHVQLAMISRAKSRPFTGFCSLPVRRVRRKGAEFARTFPSFHGRTRLISRVTYIDESLTLCLRSSLTDAMLRMMCALRRSIVYYRCMLRATAVRPDYVPSARMRE